MPVTQIPSRDPLTPPADQPEQRDLFEAQHWETAYRGFNPDDVPHLLLQLQDDLSRARKREALWLSVILHLLVIILLWNSEKLMMLLPQGAVKLGTSANAEQAKDATFLELPPDTQKVTQRPDAKAISDRDRVATSKAPQINHEELKKLLQSAHPGRPGTNVQGAIAQITAIGQTTVRQLPVGTTPPLIISYSASTTPIIQLGLSSKTVDAHKFNLMRKLGIHNKAELVMWAIQKRVVKVPA